MGTPLAVDIHGLERRYTRRGAGERIALQISEWSVPQGEVHGLLGPNGAGKTSLCRILSTVLLPSAGRVSVFGHDVLQEANAVRGVVGVVFGGDRGLYPLLTASENLRYWGALYGLRGRDASEAAARLLDRVGLADRGRDRVETFSRGMKQRLHLARGLMSSPRLLLLDEPGLGLDPVATRDLRALIGEVRDEGTTILITTHDMAEAEAVCDRVTLIDGGEILGTESPSQIGAWLVSGFTVRAVVRDPQGAVAELSTLAGVDGADAAGDTVTITVATEHAVGDVLRVLADRGAVSVNSSAPSLEDVYLKVIGDRGMGVA